MGVPRLVSKAATASRSSGSPSVTEYCSARRPMLFKTSCAASATASTGKPSGLGSPTAKLVMSSCAESVRSLLSVSSVGIEAMVLKGG